MLHRLFYLRLRARTIQVCVNPPTPATRLALTLVAAAATGKATRKEKADLSSC